LQSEQFFIDVMSKTQLMFDEMTIPGLYYTCWSWFFYSSSSL